MTATPLPPVVYVPTLRDPDGTTRLRMQEMRDGSTALFAYSALDRLHAQYGDGAEWVLLTAPSLDALYADVPFDLLFVDRELTPSPSA